MSETDGPGADAAVTSGAGPGRPRDHGGRDGEEPGSESWFQPGNGANGVGGNDGADDEDWSQADWFLRTGRAGLQPDSMTESWEEDGAAGPRTATAGAPPWAADAPEPAQDAPPPWESGPWPGPGEARPTSPGVTPGPSGSWPVSSSAVSSPAAADTGNWQSTAAVVSGLVPLVLPGLVLGVLGLRRARVTGTGRTASWLAIAFSAIWAVVLTVWIASAGSTASSACGNYQNGVSYAVAQVTHDLASSAPRGVVIADLHQAISQANAAAAGAQQVLGRNAMASLTASLQQVATEASGRTSDTTLRQQVATAEAAMVSACKA
jgi:hypothetical protein